MQQVSDQPGVGGAKALKVRPRPEARGARGHWAGRQGQVKTKVRPGQGGQGRPRHIEHPLCWTSLRPLVPGAVARGSGSSCPGALGASHLLAERNTLENVFRYRAHRGRYGPPCCGRRASDLGRLVPSRSKGLSAAPQRRGAA